MTTTVPPDDPRPTTAEGMRELAQEVLDYRTTCATDTVKMRIWANALARGVLALPADDPDEARRPGMIFQVGKYYRHPTGRELHIVGGPVQTIYHMGPTLVAESLGDGHPSFVGADETSATNWVECRSWTIKDGAVLSAAD